MKINVASTILLFLFLISCKNDESVDCSLVDCAFQTFSLEFIDASGNNLIENGTYLLANITISKDGNQLSFNSSESDILFFEASGKQGINTYEVKLSESKTDELVLDLNRTSLGSECCGPFFEIKNATYNNSSVEVIVGSFITELTVTIQ